MVKFLISRPIAVTMTFIALLALGVITSFRLPVSLMPDVDIPKITVQVNAANLSSRELESAVVSQLRMQLIQVAHLSDIKSETRDGSSVINLEFDYGTNIDFAFIEANEKIDRQMASLPRSIDRPRVIKASATDIPVFYLNLTLKDEQPFNKQSSELYPVSQEFSELSSFAGQVIRKRIEQLPQVAIADMSGTVSQEILIMPDIDKINSLGISLAAIESALNENNLNMGNLVIRDGQYQYNVRFGNKLQTIKDISDIYMKSGDRILQLKEIARVIEHPAARKGMVISDGQDAVTMAIIKQSDARMSDLRKELSSLVELFRSDYPEIEFTVTRDQTQLLVFSLKNLRQSLILGSFLAFIIMFFFLKDYKSPWLVGITIPASLIISLLFFSVTGISINVVSLAGLVLGIGLMVDNSIIVVDNITQYREYGLSLDDACVKGTNEVIRPLLSAVLTTCAVFIPLIFIGGITGALFYDQAIAITIVQFVSLLIRITILPVFYRLMYKNGKPGKMTGCLGRINEFNYEAVYEKGFRYVMRHQLKTSLFMAALLVGAVLLYFTLDKERLPPVTRDETILLVDWNERINIDENKRRSEIIASVAGSHLTHYTSLIGEQQFLLDHNSLKSGSESMIYMKAGSEKALNSVYLNVAEFMSGNFSRAGYSFGTTGNLFDQLFNDDEPVLMARLRPSTDHGPDRNAFLVNIMDKLRAGFPQFRIDPVIWQEQMILKVDPVQLALYDIGFDQVYIALRSAFRENQVLLITENQDFVPVILGEKPGLAREIIAGLSVINRNNVPVRLNSLLREETGYDLKTIVAGQEGEYYPVPLDIEVREVKKAREEINKLVSDDGHYEAGFSGSFYSNRELIGKLAMILLGSLGLLYLILASQFESLTLPFIVLMEIPVDMCGAFLILKLFGGGINLMSMTGIVVMTGIVINDSILKVDTYNQLMKEGYSLLRALIIGGRRRLKPIVMTSLTSVLALLPVLIFGGMGAELQRPLALTIIGGLTLGTVVSLFVVPLGYYYLISETRNPQPET